MIAAHGFFGISAITALTVQSTTGVRANHPVDPALLAATLDCLVDDLPPDGIKIGMLATEENVQVVADFLLRYQREVGGTTIPVVLDPVIRSSSGTELLSAAGVEAMRRELLHRVTWVTPNLQEMSVLGREEVATEAQMESVAIRMADEWRHLGVAATGGHLTQANDFAVGPGGKPGGWFRGEKIDSRATHGTGCAFSTALLCGLVDGLSGLEAVKRAKEYVAQAIREATPMGKGNGPMDLLWPLHQ